MGKKSKVRMTAEEAIHQLGPGYFQVKLVLTALFITFADGLVYSSVLTTCNLKGVILQISTMASFGFSHLLFGLIADWFGRRVSLRLSLVGILLFASLLIGFQLFYPNQIAMFIAQLCLAGSSGNIHVLCCLINELSSEFWFSKMLLLPTLTGCLGILFPLLITHFFGNATLITLVIVFVVLIIAIFVPFIRLPTSPRYLMQCQSQDACLNELTKISKLNKSQLPENMRLIPADDGMDEVNGVCRSLCGFIFQYGFQQFYDYIAILVIFTASFVNVVTTTYYFTSTYLMALHEGNATNPLNLQCFNGEFAKNILHNSNSNDCLNIENIESIFVSIKGALLIFPVYIGFSLASHIPVKIIIVLANVIIGTLNLIFLICPPLFVHNIIVIATFLLNATSFTALFLRVVTFSPSRIRCSTVGWCIFTAMTFSSATPVAFYFLDLDLMPIIVNCSTALVSITFALFLSRPLPIF